MCHPGGGKGEQAGVDDRRHRNGGEELASDLAGGNRERHDRAERAERQRQADARRDRRRDRGPDEAERRDERDV